MMKHSAPHFASQEIVFLPQRSVARMNYAKNEMFHEELKGRCRQQIKRPRTPINLPRRAKAYFTIVPRGTLFPYFPPESAGSPINSLHFPPDSNTMFKNQRNLPPPGSFPNWHGTEPFLSSFPQPISLFSVRATPIMMPT
jgi:hypothetical protein